MAGGMVESMAACDAVDTEHAETPSGPRIMVHAAGGATSFSLDVEGARALALRLLQFVIKTEAGSRPLR